MMDDLRGSAVDGALSITAPAFPLILRLRKPLLAGQFSLPLKSRIDRPLVFGAVLFGVGWGLAGFCPGPALAALASASSGVVVFAAAMLVGQWLALRLEERYDKPLGAGWLESLRALLHNLVFFSAQQRLPLGA